MRLMTPIVPFRQPTREEVERYVGILPDPAWKDRGPKVSDPSEWNKDHSGYLLHWWIPLLKLPKPIERIAVEAILSGAEARSNGTSVCENYLWQKYCKDPQGVVHDYLHELRANSLADAYGRVWGRLEANRMYRDFLWWCGWFEQGLIRWLALNAFSWIPWYLCKERGRLTSAPV